MYLVFADGYGMVVACMRSLMSLERQIVRHLQCSQSKDQTVSSLPDSDIGRPASLFPVGSANKPLMQLNMQNSHLMSKCGIPLP